MNITLKYCLIWYSTSILGSWRSPIDKMWWFVISHSLFSRKLRWIHQGVLSEKKAVVLGCSPSDRKRVWRADPKSNDSANGLIVLNHAMDELDIWVCLKMLCTPKANGFADHYPVFKWLAIIGKINPTFSDKPIFLCILRWRLLKSPLWL